MPVIVSSGPILHIVDRKWPVYTSDGSIYVEVGRWE